MEYKIIWTEPALTDLNNIYAYIANENPDAAQKVGENILNHVDVLEKFPFIGPAYPRDPLVEFVKLFVVSIEYSTELMKRKYQLRFLQFGMGHEELQEFEVKQMMKLDESIADEDFQVIEASNDSW